jgi:single-strand DNA-binding protein
VARRTAEAPAARNEVVLVGRVAAVAEERELPSGAVVCTWRLVVDRPPPERPTGARPVPVDTLECAAWTAGLRRTARGLQPGDVVEVQGALRRRFWRAGAVAASRCEVEATALRRLARAAPAVRAARPHAGRAGAAPGSAAEDERSDDG